MDGEIIFENREEAGKRLASLLLKYQVEKPVILALPRGGVPVGKEIAKALNSPIDVIITRKIGHPLNPEFAIGAVSESGLIIRNQDFISEVDLDWLESEVEHQKAEITRRRKQYQKDEPADVKDKTVILVDDGIATGSTMLAAIAEIKKRGAKKIIAAVPVAPLDIADMIAKEVNELVALSAPESFLGAIGAYYVNFPQLTDEDVVEILNDP